MPRSKNGATRRVPLSSVAVSALRNLRERYEATGFVCGVGTHPRRWFEPAVRAAEPRGFTYHCLRHTFASRLVMAEVDIRTLRELRGQKTLAMAVRYAHLAPTHRLATVERLAAVSETRTDTTTDTGALESSQTPAPLLQ